MFTENYTLELEGKSFRLYVGNRNIWKRTNEIVGLTVDGFIGLKELVELGSVVFDKEDMTVSFGENIARDDDSVRILYKSRQGFPYIAVPVNAEGTIIDAVFDTGAMINYINGGVEHVYEIHDYNPNPTVGDIYGHAGPLGVLIGNKGYTLDFGDMSVIENMKVLRGYEMFLGINGLFDHRFELSLRDGFVNLY